MANKTPEIGLYVDDIPMKLSEKYKPLDLRHYIEDETQIPDLFSDEYKFSAELYALEIAEFRDKEKVKQLKDSISRIDLQNELQLNSDSNVGNESEQQISVNRLSRHVKQDNNIKTMRTSIHMNCGEILKPFTTKGTTIISDNNYDNTSDNSIDFSVNAKRKLVNNMRKINPKDFENDTSSPFDNVELQTIDDMQELNDVFQAFNSKSIQTKQDSTHDRSQNSNNTNNCQTNHMNCDESGSLASLNEVFNWKDFCPVIGLSLYECNLNGVILSGIYGYQIPVNNTSSEQINPNHWLQYNNDLKLNYCSSLSKNSTAAHHLYESEANNLRSSKSASDLPTLLNSEESVIITKRERSHTPPCYSSKTKNKRHLNGRQTLILNDPYEELDQYSKDFVESISLMGFERSRVARAVKHIDRDDKKVLDFLLQVQTLEEEGYDCCESEIALHMNNYQPLKAKKFLESLRQLSEVGFDKEAIVKALVKCNNDRDKALDILLNDE